MVNLVCVSYVGERRRVFLTWLQASDIPAADETVTVTREHESRIIDCVEAESSNVSLNQQLLLVHGCIQGVVGGKIILLPIIFAEVVQVVFRGLRTLYVIDSFAFSLVLDD